MSKGTSTFTMKLIIDKKSNRVLYAEATKSLVDFLLSVFHKPLGSIASQFLGGAKPGCLGNLHKSVAHDLSDDFLESKSDTKAALVDPDSVKHLYRCSITGYIDCKNYVSDVNSARCPSCSNLMNHKLKRAGNFGLGRVGFVKEQVIYMITDDLVVKPLTTGSSIAILNQLSVKDVGCIRETEVTFDSTQGMELLKTSLTSNTVLTDTFLDR